MNTPGIFYAVTSICGNNSGSEDEMRPIERDSGRRRRDINRKLRKSKRKRGSFQGEKSDTEGFKDD